MFFHKIKTLTLVLLTLGVLGAGLGLLYQPRSAAQPPVEKKPDVAKPAVPAKDPLPDLLTKRFEAAKTWFEARNQESLAGRTDLDVLIEAALRLLEAELELKRRPAEQLTALEAHRDRMKGILDVMDQKYKTGRASIAAYKQTEYYHLDAEIKVERAKRKLMPPSGD